MSRWFGRRKEEKAPVAEAPAPAAAADTFKPEVSGNVLDTSSDFR